MCKRESVTAVTQCLGVTIPEGGFFLHTPRENRDKLASMTRGQSRLTKGDR
jgi:hypothetical protein